MARSAEKILLHSQNWQKQVSDLFWSEEILSGFGGQTVDLSANATFPALSSLSTLFEKTLDQLEMQPDSDSLMIWDRTQNIRLLSMPVHQGVMPDRASHQRAASRAFLVRSLIRTMFNYREGRRPG